MTIDTDRVLNEVSLLRRALDGLTPRVNVIEVSNIKGKTQTRYQTRMVDPNAPCFGSFADRAPAEALKDELEARLKPIRDQLERDAHDAIMKALSEETPQ